MKGVLSGGLQGASQVPGWLPPTAGGTPQARGGYAVVDLETTGSSSRRHRVVELAVVLLDRERAPQGEFSTLVDPEGPVGPTHIHGIEREHIDTADAPRFADVAPELLRLLRGRVLVGHNVGCDRAFLVAEYARIGVALPTVPVLCTMRMAALRVPAPRGFSLEACAEDAGLSGWPAHTALGDARATARLFAHYTQGEPWAPAELGEAAALEWPHMPAADALWIGRRPTDNPAEKLSRAMRWNDPAQAMVPNVRNGGA